MVPSCPAPSITTPTALLKPVVMPRTPAMNARFCVWPIHVVLDTVAIPPLPMAMLLLPVVRFEPAFAPRAVLLWALLAVVPVPMPTPVATNTVPDRKSVV